MSGSGQRALLVDDRQGICARSARGEGGEEILTTADLAEVGELAKGLAVAEGHEDEAVVDEGGEEVDDGRLLAAAGGARRDEHGHVLARERALRPELARRVEECLHTPRELTGHR